MAYRVQDHAIDNSIPHKKEIPLVKFDSQTNSTTCIHVPKAVTREEMASLLPTTWVTNYEKLFQNTKPVQSTDATFTSNPDKTVTIQFDRGKQTQASAPTPSVFPTQYMMQPMFTTQSTKFNMTPVLPEKNIDILNFQPSGQPVYAFTSSTGHCYWDLDCPCKYCDKRRRRHSFYDDENDDRARRKRSSQKSLQRRYENGDPEVDLLGEPSGKFDYYVLYPKKPSKPVPTNSEVSSPPLPPPKPDLLKDLPPPPKPKQERQVKPCKATVKTVPVQSLPQICMFQPTSSPSTYIPQLREFPPLHEYNRDQYRYLPQVPNPRTCSDLLLT